MKNCIKPHYEKLKPLKSGFIENSNFENNRDPWSPTLVLDSFPQRLHEWTMSRWVSTCLSIDCLLEVFFWQLLQLKRIPVASSLIRSIIASRRLLKSKMIRLVSHSSLELVSLRPWTCKCKTCFWYLPSLGFLLLLVFWCDKGLRTNCGLLLKVYSTHKSVTSS